MPHISMTQDLPARADDVWKRIGGFNALPEWHPEVEKSELDTEGQIRKLSLAGGGTILEKLVGLDDGARTYSYTIEEGPLPVENYQATLAVRVGAEGCTVHWSSEFEVTEGPESDAVRMIEGIYQAGFDSLKSIFGE